MDKKRKWAVRVLGGFLLMMAVCTVISRMAASLLVAQVQVEKPGRGRLSYSCEGEGEIIPAEEVPIFLWQNQQIEWVAAQGSLVKTGECLVQFRMEYLQQEIEKKQAEVEQLRLQAAQQQVSARTPERVPSTAGASMHLEEARRQYTLAQQKAAAAQAAYEQFVGEAGKSAAAAGSSGADVKTGSMDAGGGGVDAGNSTGAVPPEDNGGISARKTEETSGEQAARGQELQAAVQETQGVLEAAQQAVLEAENAYTLASREDAAQDTNAANAVQAAQLGVQSVEVQVEQAEQALVRLQSYQESGGKLCAERDCIVLDPGVQIGAFTTGAEVLLTGCGGWKLKGQVAAGDEEKLKVGAEAEVRLGTGAKKTVKITSIEKTQSAGNTAGGSGNETGGESYLSQGMQSFWYAALPEHVEVQGTGDFLWSTEAASEKEYEQIIPLGALREDVNGTYCLILEEKETMLGTVQAAGQVYVKVLEKDTKNAAVSSTLQNTDRIIASSEKYVEEGDRVRIKD